MNSPGEKAQARLGALLRDFESLSQHQVGYPCNQNFDYSELLSPFCNIAPTTSETLFTTAISAATPTR